jgi:Fur family ferric uptake transcriptional regulator
MRNTKQKEAIRQAFLDAGRPLSPEEAHLSARKLYRRLGIATVYRNINALLEDNWLLCVEIPGSSPRYEVAGKKHHHHFHCNECGRVYELEGCVAKAKPRLPPGFHATGHEFFLYGTCVGCATR